MKAKHIKMDGTITEVTPLNGTHFQLDELQAFVGGYIERVVTPTGEEMYVNEEGKLLGLNINVLATKLYGNLDDVICGDVILGHPDLFRSPEEREELTDNDYGSEG